VVDQRVVADCPVLSMLISLGRERNFGITNCAKLAALERQQFATYGITSPDDIRRLTKLITATRKLRARVLICGHGADSPAAMPLPESSRRTVSVHCDLGQTVQRGQKKQLVASMPYRNLRRGN